MRDSKNQLSGMTVTLHWLVGVVVVLLVLAGIIMSEFEVRALYPLHKSIGVLIFLVVLLRVYWRAVNGWLATLAEDENRYHQIAKITHWVLILSTVIMPVSGFLMSALGGHGVSVFGLELVASNYDPETGKAIPHNASVAGFAHETHGIVGWVLLIAIILHIAGALRHHLIKKDGTLRRMLGKKV